MLPIYINTWILFCFYSQDLDTSQATPVMPVRSLTPTLLQSRKRFGTSSATSQSYTYLSSMGSECCSSPRWEKDVEVRTVSSFHYKLKSAYTCICTVADLCYLLPPVISSVVKPSYSRRSRGCNACWIVVLDQNSIIFSSNK